MVEKKKRSRIAKKPSTPPPEADAWVGAGGEDPEIAAGPPPEPEPPAATLLLDDIKDRHSGDTRPLNNEHVKALAESIAAVGLIEPLAVDNQGRLLAGGHRRAAIEYLRQQELDAYQQQFPGDRIPVRQIDFDSEQAPEQALEIEITENEQRRDYTPAEVRQLADRLRGAGYEDTPGRPKKGERRLRPALEIIVGKSLPTIRRYLNSPPLPSPNEQNKETRSVDRVSRDKHLKRAIASLKKWEAAAPTDDDEQKLLSQLQGILKKLGQGISKDEGES